MKNWKGIQKAAKILMKIFEVGHWVAAGLMAASAVCAAAAPQWLRYLTDVEELRAQESIATYGFEVTVTDAAGVLDRTAFGVYAVGAVILLSLMAMVFRNFYLILRRSEGGSPFQKDNIRMLREIGIFSISIPIVCLVMSIVIRLAAGVDAVETSVSLSGFTMGLLVLCLTQFFAYGAELERDVDGLL